MNFTRPQVYIRRKEDIKRLEDDFTKSGNTNLSEYFRELIILGLDFKNKEDNVSVTKEIKELKKEMKSLLNDVSLIKRMMYEIFLQLERLEGRNGK